MKPQHRRAFVALGVLVAVVLTAGIAAAVEGTLSTETADQGTELHSTAFGSQPGGAVGDRSPKSAVITTSASPSDAPPTPASGDAASTTTSPAGTAAAT